MPIKLIACNGIKNEANRSQVLPTRLKVFNWGKNETLKGVVDVNDQTVQVFNTNQAKMGRGVIVLDYEHNTVPKTPEYERTKEPRDVAAHLSCSVVSGDGVYCDVQDWTPSGQASAKNYVDLSPAPYVDQAGTLLGLHSVALTNTGAVIDLTFLSAEAGSPFFADLVCLSATADAMRATGMGGGPPLLQVQKTMNAHVEVFRKFLGMDGKSDEDVLKCMAAEMSSGKICRTGPLDNAAGGAPGIKPVPGAVGEGNQGIKQLVADEIKELKDQLKTLAAEAISARQEREEAKATSDRQARRVQIERANKEGKVIPLSAEEIAGTSVVVLTKMIDALPNTLSTKRSPEAIVAKGATGRISSQPTKLFTMNADGSFLPVVMNAPQRGEARARTAERFQKEIDALKTHQTA